MMTSSFTPGKHYFPEILEAIQNKIYQSVCRYLVPVSQKFCQTLQPYWNILQWSSARKFCDLIGCWYFWNPKKVLASLRKLQAMELNQHERHCVQLHFDFLQLQSHLITENASFTSSKFRLVECINLGMFYNFCFILTFFFILFFYHKIRHFACEEFLCASKSNV